MSETTTASPWNDAAGRGPAATKRPSIRTMHGDQFTDPYEWLRAKEDPEVLEHLTAENQHAESVTQPLADLRTSIFDEIRDRTQETDLSVPTRTGDWWWFRRTVEGKNYPVFCRVPVADPEDWTPPVVPADAALPGEQTVLDANAEAEGLRFFSLGSFSATPDGRLLTWSVDDAGDERYTQYVKDLETGRLLRDRLEDVFAGGFLTPSGTHLVYLVVDDAWRPCQVRAHRLGTPREQDLLLFDEPEPTMWLGAGVSSDESHLVVESGCSEYSEVHLLDLAELETAADAAPLGWSPLSREAGVLYEAEPVLLDGESFLLLSHDHEAPNGELLAVPANAARSASSWADLAAAGTVLLPATQTRRLNGFALNADHLALSLRENTLEKVAFVGLDEVAAAVRGGTPLQSLVEPRFGEELLTAGLVSLSVRSPVVGISTTSFTTPQRRWDYFPATGELVLRKETPVLGGFRAEDYLARREWAPAPDGARIPVSVVHRADLDLSVPHPVVQYGYGSYEASMDPGFSVPRLSVLDRGVVWVVAHVRGGGELGRNWYSDGKKLAKKNTFTDFVAVTDWLDRQPWADGSRITAMGGSAGGLLMGAVANLAPENYAGILAQVPFVDPVTTVVDPELPLSALEWEEWGNPIEDPTVYEYMRSYSPYENVGALKYPPIAAVTSLNDTRVLYVEPAKWVAALREHSASEAPVLLKIEMDGGHGGGSGRYKRWEEIAWDYAFLLACMGITA